MTVSGSRAGARRRRRGAIRDVVLVGGGMVGAAAALALARAGLTVSLVEARQPEPWHAEDDVDLRVVALAPSSAALLQDLGVWAAVREARAQAYRHMHVWDAASSAALDFDAAEEGRDALGWIVENRLLQHTLWSALDAAGVQCVCPAGVQSFEQADGHVRLTLDNGEALDTRLLVAADGGASPLRGQAGIATHGRDYAQRAVVAHVATEQAHANTAWQRFTPDGVIAFLPLADGRSSVVWSLPEAEAQRMLALDDAAFADAVGVAGDLRLGRVTGVSRRAAFPLKLQLAKAYQSERLVLVGDAAHMVHPLAGQGANLGLRDVAELRDTLQTANLAGRDIGSSAVLRRYARRRRSADTLDAYAFDGLERAFGWRASPLVGMRALGMRALQQLPPLRRALSLHAAGR
ncbi:MAG TPA: FAD-dependent oxidoreductase [Oleiagrimonas sp.]|nr:FAD-dependent oxidoreductase [Oleiagrimonas sp.]